MTVFLLCPGCSRHFRHGEPACPFCGESAAGLLPKAVPVLSSGASRSRRYAASAAILASSAAVFSCGGADAAGGSNASSGTGGSSSSSTGAGNSNTSAGTNSATNGATSTSGSSSTSAGGGSGTSSSTSGGLDTGRACEGYEGAGNCRTVADCDGLFPDQGLAVYCAFSAPNTQVCGNPLFLPMCPSDCGEGMICVSQDGCGGSVCQAECSEENCSAPSHCVNGLCQPMPCDMDGAAQCAEGYRCDPTLTTSPSGCVPIRCTENLDACASWQSCLEAGGDLFGCAAKGCGADEECGECGYCVNGACAPSLGTCYQEQPAMPYGCVWPDEELV